MKHYLIIAQVKTHYVRREDIEAALKQTFGPLVEQVSIQELGAPETEIERCLRIRSLEQLVETRKLAGRSEEKP